MVAPTDPPKDRRLVASMNQLRTRVRRQTGDLDGDRWGTAPLDEAINDQLVDMANDLAISHPGEAITYTTMTYPAGTSDPVDLPAAVAAEAIYRVDDVTVASRPVQLDYCSPLSGLDLDLQTGLVTRGKMVYTLFGPEVNADPADDSGITGRIKLFPRDASSTTLRLYYFQRPFVMPATEDGATTDELDDIMNPFSPRWLELIALGAAIKLLRRDDEVSNQQIMAYAALKQQFTSFAARRRGPQRIRRKRIWV